MAGKVNSNGTSQSPRQRQAKAMTESADSDSNPKFLVLFCSCLTLSVYRTFEVMPAKKKKETKEVHVAAFFEHVQNVMKQPDVAAAATITITN